MKVERKTFGILGNGDEVSLFTLEAGDISLSMTEFGASWTSLAVPSRKGRADILLGFPSFEGYANNGVFFGVTVGRFANRIGGARFNLDGRDWTLYQNDGNNSLHGGRSGFSYRLWKGESYTDGGGIFVRFEIESPDGDEGYPGNLRAAVTYGLNGDNELSALYEARVDRNCPVNLTNHAYFNLAGEGSGNILDHEMKLCASRYVEVNAALIPTGKLLPVEGTPFDFRASKPIARDYAAACGGNTEASGTGYDHCFALDNYGSGELLPCAQAAEPLCGRIMKVFTTQPGVQFYSGNFLAGVRGKPGSLYGKNAGFCLETQHFPDSPNRPEFPDAVFGPARPYREKTVFAFDW